MFKVPEKFRIKNGLLGSEASIGNNGAFWVKTKKHVFTVIAIDQMGWEHVSVSLPTRCPTWEEMCFIKSLFWSDDACVIQYHPAKSEYVNNHPNCLHLWRPVFDTMPVPPSQMVGVKSDVA
ncbi:hypothetical protein EXE10_20410 [Acinetobacter sp. WCHAc060033]|uniref:DUF7694 domain-containing protein n=1 Tax=Acinetobacter sp. WCHAc060033 TaxID=2518624 RepID=UPI001023BFC6|nr:hypothetical protein [Acinetobacter sp. WCHAc060033]RZG74996.1 hypothetical protein EXE10_20410 [Acinetobacter sp. WCHAc060033]